MFWIGLGIGLFVGCIIGFVVATMFCLARENEDRGRE